ncbi:YggT family protein [Oceanobacillus sp. 1P07AA]|uniref:YggT family protein n=1 Tax=Oceanobacillus sp. 1P07AA TaxID=3132293 RepID=UPI0039A4A566
MIQILNLINMGITIYSLALFVYIMLSWLPGARDTSFGELLGKICEPYLEIFRKFIPPLGMIDLSPLVAILVLNLANQGIIEFFRMFMY